MNLLNRLERRFGRFAVPNVTIGVIVLQVMVFVLMHVPGPDGANGGEALKGLQFIPQKVLEGEVWRVVTFLAVPPLTNLIFAFFFWYLFYLMGTALEHYWGTFRYNVFLLIGYVATVGAAFAVPEVPATNAFLEGSVFLAFATLCPNFVLYIFLVLPVRIKWLALLTWIGYGLAVLFGPWQIRVVVLASAANYFAFFGRDIWLRMRVGRRHMSRQISRFTKKEPEFYHECAVCGITDRTHPQMDFRYCSDCDGNYCYCSEHLRNHEHVRAEESAQT